MYQPISLKIKDTFSFEKQQYEFVQGKPIIIVGENMDDPSQQRNGSGKSSFVECIAIAYLGSPVRNATSKEIVRRGAKISEIEHLLFNSVDNKYLKIIRRTYSGSKSAECELYQGKSAKFKPEDRIVCSDINEYNKKVFELIGISKDDFLQFYILTAKYYKPFLLSSDTVKKEIVNRFSNAQIIDNVFPHIDDEVNEIEQQYIKAKSLVDQLIGKKELYEQQLQEKTDKQANIDQEKKAQKISINKQIDDNKAQLDQVSVEIAQLATEIDSKQVEFTNHDWGQEQVLLEDKQSYLTDEISAHASKISTAVQEIDDKVKTKFADQYTEYNESKDEFNQIVQQLNKTIAQQRKLIDVANKEKSKLKNSLHDSITCPNCDHVFSIDDEEFDKDKIESMIEQVDQAIAEYNKTIEDSQLEIDEYQAALDEDLPQMKKELDDLSIAEKAKLMKDLDKLHEVLSKLKEDRRQVDVQLKQLTDCYKAQKDELKSLDSQLKSANDRHNAISKTIVTLKQSLKAVDDLSYQDEIDQLDGDIIQTEMKINDQKTQVEELEQKKRDSSLWNENFKQFKSYIANQSINNIEVYANLFLQQMNTDLSIVLSGYKVLQSTKQVREQISVTIQRNGVDIGSYGTFSGGERGRIDVAVILAIQQLINLNSPTGGLNLLIADEVLDNIEPLGLESIIFSCEDLGKNILIVSQNEINALKKSTLTIRKQNKISTFVE